MHASGPISFLCSKEVSSERDTACYVYRRFPTVPGHAWCVRRMAVASVTASEPCSLRRLIHGVIQVHPECIPHRPPAALGQACHTWPSTFAVPRVNETQDGQKQSSHPSTRMLRSRRLSWLCRSEAVLHAVRDCLLVHRLIMWWYSAFAGSVAGAIAIMFEK